MGRRTKSFPTAPEIEFVSKPAKVSKPRESSWKFAGENKKRSNLQYAKELEEQHGQPDKSEIVHQFPNGWSVRKLKTLGDLRREGELMRQLFRS